MVHVAPNDTERTILHVDADSFFASCHVAREPERLSGRPVAVAGDPAARAGVVLSASYEARRCGVRAAMPVAAARRLCPELITLPPEFALYRDRSAALLRLLEGLSPAVEPFSIDEAWVDLTGCPAAGARAESAARALAHAAMRDLGLPVSVGIAENKLLAKMAAAMGKPRGLVRLRRSDVPLLLWPRPVSDLFGVGPALSERLKAWNVRTVGDLAALGPAFCERRLGRAGSRLWAAAHGRDDSPVTPPGTPGGAVPRSVSHGTTLAEDAALEAEVRPVLFALAEEVARRLRARALLAGSVTVTLRRSDFREVHASAPLDQGSDMGGELFRTAMRAIRSHCDGRARYRMVALAAHRLRPAARAVRQPSLLDRGAALEAAARLRAAARAGDAIRERLGERALMPAAFLLRGAERPGGAGTRKGAGGASGTGGDARPEPAAGGAEPDRRRPPARPAEPQAPASAPSGAGSRRAG